MDIAGYVEPQHSAVTCNLPLKFDGIDRQALSQAQREVFQGPMGQSCR